MLMEFAEKCRARNSYVNQFNGNYASLNQTYSYISSKEYKSAAKISYLIRMFICIAIEIICVAALVLMDLYLEPPKSKDIAYSAFIIASIAASLVLFIVAFSLSWFYLSRHLRFRKKKRYVDKNRPVLEKNCSDLANLIQKADEELTKYDLLTSKYFYAGEHIVDYIINRRADSIKEAINLFEPESRRNVQLMQMQRLNEQMVYAVRQLRSN